MFFCLFFSYTTQQGADTLFYFFIHKKEKERNTGLVQRDSHTHSSAWYHVLSSISLIVMKSTKKRLHQWPPNLPQIPKCVSYVQPDEPAILTANRKLSRLICIMRLRSRTILQTCKINLFSLWDQRAKYMSSMFSLSKMYVCRIKGSPPAGLRSDC